MRKIVHLSDLHFGRIDTEIPPALSLAIREAKPDLIVVSGDFTQRAREEEFKQARDFLTELPGPLLLVPGNHDVPLYDVVRRWIAPLERYRRYITDDLAPFHADAEIAVAGVTTARALTFKNGRINRDQVAQVGQRMAVCGPDVMRIVVTHHPFDVPAPVLPGTASDGVVGRADMAMAGFLRARVDMILSGHLHRGHTGQNPERYPYPGRAVLLVQAGTATSTRTRDQGNTFNVIRIAQPEVGIVRMEWQPARAAFIQSGTERFLKTETGWSRMDTDVQRR